LPLQVKQSALDVLVLTLKKIGVVTAFTNEALRGTIPSVEQVVLAKLREDIATGLDAVLFGTAAASAAAPAGLRNSIAATAATVGADADVNFNTDMSAIVGAVAAVAGAQPILICAGPSTGRRIKQRIGAVRDPGFEVFISAGIAENVVIAIASNALCSIIGAPELSRSSGATLVMEDTNPTDISTGAVSANVKSLFQTDASAVRLTLPITWGLRSASGLAWVENCNW
jgi:hypothetical protein